MQDEEEGEEVGPDDVSRPEHALEAIGNDLSAMRDAVDSLEAMVREDRERIAVSWSDEIVIKLFILVVVGAGVLWMFVGAMEAFVSWNSIRTAETVYQQQFFVLSELVAVCAGTLPIIAIAALFYIASKILPRSR